MELFTDLAFRRGGVPSVAAAEPWVILTPAGPVALRLRVGQDRTDAMPHRLRLLTSGAGVAAWHTDRFQASLLTTVVEPGSPPRPDSGGCVGALWRLKAWADLPPAEFETAWPAPRVTRLRSDARDGLFVRSWESGGVRLVIGTPDVQRLVTDARENWGLPRRLASLMGRDTVTSEPGSVRVRLPALARHEQGQVQFVVAWTHGPTPEVTWLAVDRHPDELLAAANAA